MYEKLGMRTVIKLFKMHTYHYYQCGIPIRLSTLSDYNITV